MRQKPDRTFLVFISNFQIIPFQDKPESPVNGGTQYSQSHLGKFRVSPYFPNSTTFVIEIHI